MTKIAVLGSGWGGLSIFCDLIIRGHDVNLWNHSEESLRPIMKRGRVQIADSEGEFMVNINPKKNIVSTNIERVIEGVELIINPLPLQYQASASRLMAPFLKNGQTILLVPGSAGSLETAKIFREMKMDKDVLLAEGNSLPMSGRRLEPGVIRTSSPQIRSLNKPDRIQRLSAFPANRTGEAMKKLEDIYNYLPAKNALEVGMLNVNFLIHPAPYIMNTGIIENKRGEFSLLNEGISSSVINVMNALDAEKLELCKTLRLATTTVEDCYGADRGLVPAYLKKVPGPLGFKDRIPDVKNIRYLIEDTCGIVMWSSLGDLVGVETLISDSVVVLANIIQGIDFWKFGRTVNKLGLTGMSVNDIEKYLYEG